MQRQSPSAKMLLGMKTRPTHAADLRIRRPPCLERCARRPSLSKTPPLHRLRVCYVQYIVHNAACGTQRVEPWMGAAFNGLPWRTGPNNSSGFWTATGATTAPAGPGQLSSGPRAGRSTATTSAPSRPAKSRTRASRSCTRSPEPWASRSRTGRTTWKVPAAYAERPLAPRRAYRRTHKTPHIPRAVSGLNRLHPSPASTAVLPLGGRSAPGGRRGRPPASSLVRPVPREPLAIDERIVP